MKLDRNRNNPENTDTPQKVYSNEVFHTVAVQLVSPTCLT